MSSRTIPRKSILANFENDPRIHPFLPRTHLKHVLSCISVLYYVEITVIMVFYDFIVKFQNLGFRDFVRRYEKNDES